MAKHLITLFIFILPLVSFSQKNTVEATITVGNSLDVDIQLIFKRQSVDSSNFYLTTLNIGDYVRHKEPKMGNASNSKVFNGNVLSGSWYSNDSKDLIIGAYLKQGKDNEIINIKIPDLIQRDFESNKTIFVRKASDDILQLIENKKVDFIGIESVKVKFDESSRSKTVQSNNWTLQSNSTYKLDFSKTSEGFIKFRPISYFNDIGFLVSIFIALFIAYVIYISILESNQKSKNTLRVVYFLVAIVFGILSYVFYFQVEKSIWLTLFGGFVGFILVTILSVLLSDNAMKLGLKILEKIKTTE